VIDVELTDEGVVFTTSSTNVKLSEKVRTTELESLTEQAGSLKVSFGIFYALSTSGPRVAKQPIPFGNCACITEGGKFEESGMKRTLPIRKRYPRGCDAVRKNYDSFGDRHSFDLAPVLSVAFSPDGGTLAVAESTDPDDLNGQGRIVFWRTDIWNPTTIITVPRPAKALEFLPDGQLLIGSCFDAVIRVWKFESRKVQLRHMISDAIMVAFAIAPDGKQLASPQNRDESIGIWSMRNLTRINTLKPEHSVPFTNINAVAWSTDTSKLAAASGRFGKPGRIRIWDVDSKQTLNSFPAHSGRIDALRFSPDGKLLASCSADGTSILWGTDTFSARSILRGHTDDVHALAFLPDGTILATASFDSTVQLWDTRTGQRRAILSSGDSNWVMCVAFTPDGRSLAAGDSDGQVRIWQIDRPDYESGILRHNEFSWPLALVAVALMLILWIAFRWKRQRSYRHDQLASLDAVAS
jgi:WD40 repeat protein